MLDPIYLPGGDYSHNVIDKTLPFLSQRSCWLFFIDCAEHVLPIFEARFPRDLRPRLCIEASRRCAHERLSYAELVPIRGEANEVVRILQGRNLNEAPERMGDRVEPELYAAEAAFMAGFPGVSESRYENGLAAARNARVDFEQRADIADRSYEPFPVNDERRRGIFDTAFTAESDWQCARLVEYILAEAGNARAEWHGELPPLEGDTRFIPLAEIIRSEGFRFFRLIKDTLRTKAKLSPKEDKIVNRLDEAFHGLVDAAYWVRAEDARAYGDRGSYGKGARSSVLGLILQNRRAADPSATLSMWKQRPWLTGEYADVIYKEDSRIPGWYDEMKAPPKGGVGAMIHPGQVGAYYTTQLSWSSEQPFDIYKNPSYTEITKTMGFDTELEPVRGLLDGNNVYLWQATKAVHRDVIDKLGWQHKDLFLLTLYPAGKRGSNKLAIDVCGLGEFWPTDWRTHPYFASVPKFFVDRQVEWWQSYAKPEGPLLSWSDAWSRRQQAKQGGVVGAYFTTVPFFEKLIDVYKNPSFLELRDKLGLGKGEVVRAFIGGNDLYAWPSYDAQHEFIAVSLGWDSDNLIRVEFFPMPNMPRVKGKELLIIELKAEGERIPVLWETHPYFVSRPKIFSTWDVKFQVEIDAIDMPPQTWEAAQRPIGVVMDDVDDGDIEELRKWILTAITRLSPMQQESFAADCAERVLPIYEHECPKDKRPRKAIRIRRLFAHGKATQEQWDAALYSVREARGDAYRNEVGLGGKYVLSAVAPSPVSAVRAAVDAVTYGAPSEAEEAEIRWQWNRVKEYQRGETGDSVGAWHDWRPWQRGAAVASAVVIGAGLLGTLARRLGRRFSSANEVREQAHGVVDDVAATHPTTDPIAIDLNSVAVQRHMGEFAVAHHGLALPPGMSLSAAYLSWMSGPRQYDTLLRTIYVDYRNAAALSRVTTALHNLDASFDSPYETGPTPREAAWREEYAQTELAPEVTFTQEIAREFTERGFTVVPTEIGRSGLPADIDPRLVETALLRGGSGLDDDEVSLPPRDLRREAMDMPFGRPPPPDPRRRLTVTLGAHGNADFGQGARERTRNLPHEERVVHSLLEARDICLAYIREHDLGSGNWAGGLVAENGVPVAQIRLNGRAWDMAGQEIAIATGRPLQPPSDAPRPTAPADGPAVHEVPEGIHPEFVWDTSVAVDLARNSEIVTYDGAGRIWVTDYTNRMQVTPDGSVVLDAESEMDDEEFNAEVEDDHQGRDFFYLNAGSETGQEIWGILAQRIIDEGDDDGTLARFLAGPPSGVSGLAPRTQPMHDYYQDADYEEIGRRKAAAEEMAHMTVSVPKRVALDFRKRADEKGLALSRFAGGLLTSDARRLNRPAPKPSRQRNYCDPAKPGCGYTLQGGICAVEAPLYIAARGGALGVQRISARYCAIEIEQLLTSHKPLTGFGNQEGYPTEAQERDYRLPLEAAKVRQIAEHYEPDLIFNTSPGALDGLPVSTEDRIVLGGNGRTMATALVYNGEGNIKPDELRAYVLSHAAQFGLTKTMLAKLRHPMIVRVIRSERDARALAEWSRALNASLSVQLDSTRIAVSRARFVDKAALAELNAMDDEETLAQFLSSPRSSGFVAALRAANVIDARSTAQYLSGGMLNQAGRDLVADLLLAYIIPDAVIITALGPQVVSTLARSASYIIRTMDLAEYNIAPPMTKAIYDYLDMRKTGETSVDKFLRQDTLFAGNAPKSSGDLRALILLQTLSDLGTSPTKLAKMMRRYVTEALAPGRGQGGLFAVKVRNPLDTLRLVAKEAGIKLPLATKVGGLGYVVDQDPYEVGARRRLPDSGQRDFALPPARPMPPPRLRPSASLLERSESLYDPRSPVATAETESPGYIRESFNREIDLFRNSYGEEHIRAAHLIVNSLKKHPYLRDQIPYDLMFLAMKAVGMKDPRVSEVGARRRLPAPGQREMTLPPLPAHRPPSGFYGSRQLSAGPGVWRGQRYIPEFETDPTWQRLDREHAENLRRYEALPSRGEDSYRDFPSYSDEKLANREAELRNQYLPDDEEVGRFAHRRQPRRVTASLGARDFAGVGTMRATGRQRRKAKAGKVSARDFDDVGAVEPYGKPMGRSRRSVSRSAEGEPCRACAGEGGFPCPECGSHHGRVYCGVDGCNAMNPGIRMCPVCRGTGKEPTGVGGRYPKSDLGKKQIQAALRQADGFQGKAAEILEISQGQLSKLMRQHRIEKTEEQREHSRERMSEGARERFFERSLEERAESIRRMQEGRAALPSSVLSETARHSWQTRPPEAKQAFRAKRSDSMKSQWADMTPAQKAARAAAVRRGHGKGEDVGRLPSHAPLGLPHLQ